MLYKHILKSTLFSSPPNQLVMPEKLPGHKIQSLCLQNHMIKFILFFQSEKPQILIFLWGQGIAHTTPKLLRSQNIYFLNNITTIRGMSKKMKSDWPVWVAPVQLTLESLHCGTLAGLELFSLLMSPMPWIHRTFGWNEGKPVRTHDRHFHTTKLWNTQNSWDKEPWAVYLLLQTEMVCHTAITTEAAVNQPPFPTSIQGV